MKKSLLLNGLVALLSLFALVTLQGQASARLPERGTTHTGPYVPAVLADPADWVMYGHDPQRTNYNPAESTISAGNVSQLVERWRAYLGNSSPTSGAPNVSNGITYSGSSVTSGNNYFAFESISGTQVWSTTVGHGVNCFSTGIGSTAVISGSVLSVGGGDGAFYGLDAGTGGQLWREPMNVGTSGFPWASPLLAYGRSYLGMASCADNPSVRGEVRAVDMNVGGQLANQYFVPAGQRGAGVWNSPALSPDGSLLVVTTGEDYGGYNGPYNRAIVSLDPITLDILQSNQQGPLGGDVDYATTPLFFSDSLGRTLVGAIHKNSNFYAFVADNITGGPIWFRSVGYSAGMMPAYDPSFGTGGTLFVSNGSRVYAVNPENGTDRWPFVTSSGLHGNLAVANGLLFLNRGGLLEIRSETDGSVLRTITPTTTGSTYTGPIVSHGFVYWLSGGWLNAWSLPAGSTPTPTNTVPVATDTPTQPPATPSHTTPIPNTNTPTQTPTIEPSSTATVPTFTSVPTNTPTLTATSTTTTGPSSTPQATATSCNLSFTDVPTGSTFYTYIRCLACRGIVNGYADGTFKPNNNVTRGQLSKIVTNAAGFIEPVSGQTYQDVPPGSTFYDYIERLASRGFISGYPCGGIPSEPCIPPDNRPYFRTNSNAVRAQISKIVSNAAGFQEPHTEWTFEDMPPGSSFYDYIERLASRGIISGYTCGSAPLEPCVPPANRPYFRPFNNATRGQTSKIVANAFFQDCETPARR